MVLHRDSKDFCLKISDNAAVEEDNRQPNLRETHRMKSLAEVAIGFAKI
jgi:hypothetical protein